MGTLDLLISIVICRYVVVLGLAGTTLPLSPATTKNPNDCKPRGDTTYIRSRGSCEYTSGNPGCASRLLHGLR